MFWLSDLASDQVLMCFKAFEEDKIRTGKNVVDFGNAVKVYSQTMSRPPPAAVSLSTPSSIERHLLVTIGESPSAQPFVAKVAIPVARQAMKDLAILSWASSSISIGPTA